MRLNVKGNYLLFFNIKIDHIYNFYIYYIQQEKDVGMSLKRELTPDAIMIFEVYKNYREKA